MTYWTYDGIKVQHKFSRNIQIGYTEFNHIVNFYLRALHYCLIDNFQYNYQFRQITQNIELHKAPTLQFRSFYTYAEACFWVFHMKKFCVKTKYRNVWYYNAKIFCQSDSFCISFNFVKNEFSSYHSRKSAVTTMISLFYIRWISTSNKVSFFIWYKWLVSHTIHITINRLIHPVTKKSEVNLCC